MTNGDDSMNPYVSAAGNTHEGLTKREYFAAMAMAAYFKMPIYLETAVPFEQVAKDAVYQADALIDALNAESK